MSGLVAVLVLGSTFMHAGWNLLARRRRAELVLFNRMLIVAALAGFVPAVLSEALTHSLTPKAWLCVAGSGCFAGFYYSLSRARMPGFRFYHCLSRGTGAACGEHEGVPGRRTLQSPLASGKMPLAFEGDK